MKLPWTPLVMALSLLLSCTPRDASDGAGQTSSDTPAPEAPLERTEARYFSYSRTLGEASLTLVSRALPDGVGDPPGVLVPAYSGRWKYHAEGQSLFAYEAFAVQQPAADAPWEPDNDLLYPSEPQGRWQAPFAIVAGPAVFADVVLVATAEPAFAVLDRRDLALRFTRPMSHLALGPMLVDEAGDTLTLRHADGSSGVYALSSSLAIPAPLPDPVAALIGPEAGPLAAMAVKTGALLSAEGGFAFAGIDPYGPMVKVPPSGAQLVRFEAAAADVAYRIYVDGAGERPYLLALFDQAGSLISSNVEYQAAKVLEFTPGAAQVYYVAAAFMGAAGEGLAARLAIVPRQP